MNVDNLQPIIDFAESKLAEHGLSDWRFRFNDRRKSIGLCVFNHKEVQFSIHYTGVDEDQWKDTVLHEIAHALAGRAAGHGPAWRAMCRKIGAKPERCVSDSQVVEAAPFAWEQICGSCGKTVAKSFRRRTSLHNKVTCCCRAKILQKKL